MNLGWPSYLIHGTNKPAGVGLRASHGCIRMYPEDIDSVFDKIAVGTKVTVVNQPLLYRWHGDSLYVQAFPPHVDDEEDETAQTPQTLSKATADKMWQQVKQHGRAIDLALTERLVSDARGVAVPVSRRGITLESFLAGARLVENTLPAGSNWDGRDAEEAEDSPKPVADTGARGGR